MIDYSNKETQQIAGTADGFALMAAAFTYPDPVLIEGIVDGALLDDLTACLHEMDIEFDGSSLEEIRQFASAQTPEESLELMRTEYTRLFYGLGTLRIIAPHESVFRKLQVNPDTSRLTAFLTKSTHDVEAYMSTYNVLPDNARREPVDFFVTELDFMSHLYTGYLAAKCNGEDSQPWKNDIDAFLDKHVLNWMPSLMEQVQEKSTLAVYCALAKLSGLILQHAKDCLASSEEAATD